METMIDPPVNLYLWRKSASAERSEKWKWSWDTWDPTIEKLFADRSSVTQLPCPVCGDKSLYVYFLAIRLKKPVDPLTFIADRFFGCHACQTQKRDIGETPVWLKEEEIYWASEIRKKEAEKELGKKLRSPIIREPPAKGRSSQ